MPEPEDYYTCRQLTVLGPSGEPILYVGRDVHTANDKGVVVVANITPTLRIFYPWNRVLSLVAHTRDDILKF